MDLTIEPIFASLAVYDLKARKKLTENFYFDLNPDSTKDLLKSHIAYQDLSTLSKSAIFGLSQLNPDLYFVIKLEKVFQNEINDVLEAYVRPPEDQNKLDRLKSMAKNNCERLGQYRMHFAWAVFPLVDILLANTKCRSDSLNSNQSSDILQPRNSSNSLESLKRIANECTSNFSRKGSLERHLTLGSINGSNSSLERKSSITNEDLAILFGQFKPVTITSKLFYRHEADKFSDDDLYKFISEFRRSSLNTKRVRSFPCTLKLDVCSLPNESQLKSRVNSELVRLHPFPNEQATPVKEVLEFRDILMPHHEHRNLLFVYPKSVNFTSRQNSARNVTIKIQLMNSEDKFNALPIIFGKSSCPEYLSEAFTAINYHNRCPNFSEEFKIRLPSQINKQTHLFFTFIHVHTKPKNDVPLNEIVGHTWLPLWREDRLQTGTFNLPIVTEQPTPGYSFLTPNDPESLSNLKWIDNHKPIFVVHLDSYSSIFAQDAYVDRFFRITSSLECQNQINSLFHSANIFEEFNKAITGLMNSSLDSLMKFVHIILNRIIWLMIKPPSVLQNINQSHPNLSLSSLKSLKLILFETFVGLVNRLIKAQNGGTLPNGFEILKTFLQFQVIIPQPESIYNLNYNSQTRNEIVNDDSESNLFTKPLHEEIISQWLKSDEKIFNLLMVNSFFFLDLIFKSICITLSLQSNSDKLVNNKNLHKFIDKSLKNNISNLITLITSFTIKQINDELYFSPQHQHQSTLQSNQSFIDQSSDLKSVRRLENLNSSLAFFIRDLLSILERFYVFGLIKQYLTTMIASTINTDQEQSKRTSNKFNERLFKLRIDFLRIICGHEHFFALNIPFGTPLFTSLESTNNWQNGNQSGFSPSFSLAKEMLDTNLFPNLLFDQIRLFSELTEEYRRQHWLLGLVFCTLIESFTKTKYSIQTKSANILRSIQTSFDWDDRFKDSSIKHRIACLFLPLIGILIDVIEHLNDTCTKDNPFYSVLEVQKHRKINSKASNRDEDSYGSTFIENSIALAIGSSQSFGDLYENSQPPNKKTSPMHNYRLGLSYQPINPEATRILLTCLLWTIGNVDRTIFLQYLNEFSNERLLVFLELIRICTREFENKSNKTDYMSSPKLAFRKPDDTIRLHGSSRKDFLRRKDYSQSFGPTDSSNDGKIRWKRDSSVSSVPSALELMKSIDEERLQADEHLSTMVNLIVLDAINFIFNLFRQRIKCVSNFGLSSSTKSMAKNFNLKNQYANDEFVVCSAFHSLLQIFSFRQSDRVLLAALDSQRALLHLFPEILFVEGLSEIDFCSDLCYLLLKHCASKSSTVRIQAPASIYLLLRQYYQSSTNYSRIKIQITMSLSQLVGTSLAFSEINIRNALNNVLRYALNDQTVRETSFPNQVQELVFNLIMILSDTMQMKEHEKDPEMLLDLMYRISKGYQNSPVLRVTWLENMAKKHADFGQHVEAAQCYVHAAALVSECLHKVNRRSYLPVSCAAFQKVCPNVFEESLSSKSEINLDKTIYFNEDVDSKKDVHSLKLLSESGLISLLEQSAKYFQISGMFEAVNEIYKLLIPIQEHHYRYKDLAKIHSTLHDIFIKIEQQEGKRAFAAYFRVGFYGTLFGGLNQKEFIYKERFLTKLPEIANRLETFYGNRFGQENVEVIKDSNLVDVSKLENNKGNELIELVGFSIFCRSPIAYIQITYVEPYFDHWEMESRRTCFEKNYNISKF
ncbi:dedicator of cytokinesis protein 7-like protein 2 [Sarcoptes scabiei]|uniref:Dedicator of cytokinesis protein 7-like protein 2 n=1 Tax=Sarcoptes scabiei TaxID=52283 RepID=A0A132A2R7_SARSC|nr:dedicator of cytokinesis protein 7-like protein 2 [Sarcoptes scabiei]